MNKDINENEVIIDDVIYDLQKFSKVHSGGINSLNIFGGSDATVHYYMLHPHLKLRKNILEPYKLREVTINDDNKYILNSSAFQELKKKITDVVRYPYATLEWYLKAIFIMTIEILLEYHNIIYGFTYFKSICLGFFMALIGLCIQHDANHGAISKNGYINLIWGLTQDWIGGSSLLWKHHHVLMHHAYTNMNKEDPDITTNIVRLHTDIKKRYWHRWQGFYTWFLIVLLPINWHFKELLDLYNMHHMGRKISSVAQREAYLGILLRIMFILRFYIVPLYIHYSFHTFICICISLAVGGGYLGINFIISHNFEGVKHANDNYKEKDWSIIQVETSSTVGGRLLGFFHGGLNYQIEHHLFPRICHVHYYKIKPIIQLWCLEHNIKYTYFNTIADNIKSCYNHLIYMGNE